MMSRCLKKKVGIRGRPLFDIANSQIKIEKVILRLVAASLYFHPLQQVALNDGSGAVSAGL
jgi:hypothetical protein